MAKDLVEHHFDLKHLIRTIMTSEVYALSSSPIQYNAKDRRNYARYFPKRMPAEVLSDAVDALCGVSEKFPGFPQGTRAIDLPDEAVNSYFLDVFGRSHRDSPCECERSYAPNLAQVLHLLNSPELQEKLQDPQGRAATLIAAHKSPEEMITEALSGRIRPVAAACRAERVRQFATLCQGSQSRPDGFDVGNAQQQGILVQPLNE